MEDRLCQELPKSVEALLANLDELRELVTKQLADSWKADEGRIFKTDLVALGVARRTYAVIDGFVALLRQRNPLCCGALLRLQLDTAMRFYARWLVPDPGTVAEALLDDTPLDRLESNDGKKLTDYYLHTKLAGRYGKSIDSVYKATSGFVHLTGRAVFDASTDHDAATGRESVSLQGPGRVWTEPEMVEMVSAFVESVGITVNLLHSWSCTKSKTAMQRRNDKTGRLDSR